MAKIINGEITSINEGIVADIEIVAQVAQNYCNAMRQMATKDSLVNLKRIEDASQRISDYLATYKLDDPDHE